MALFQQVSRLSGPGLPEVEFFATKRLVRAVGCNGAFHEATESNLVQTGLLSLGRPADSPLLKVYLYGVNAELNSDLFPDIRFGNRAIVPVPTRLVDHRRITEEVLANELRLNRWSVVSVAAGRAALAYYMADFMSDVTEKSHEVGTIGPVSLVAGVLVLAGNSFVRAAKGESVLPQRRHELQA